MTGTEVEKMVHSVIIHLGLPFAILAVTATPVGWSIRVRAGTGGALSFTIPGGRPLAMRVAIQQKLEAAL